VTTPELHQPRSNGELVFDAPWESRVFGVAVAYVDATGQPWDAFRSRLTAAVAADPEGTPYYESFTRALEALLLSDGVLAKYEVDGLG
jgi:hypothetical protein